MNLKDSKENDEFKELKVENVEFQLKNIILWRPLDLWFFFWKQIIHLQTIYFGWIPIALSA